MIVGSSSSSIHPVDLTKFHLFESLSHREGDPTAASRPFDVTRDGAIVGEGGAAFVIERYEHALRRGARIYAEILAVGAGCDGRGWDNGSGGRGVARAVQAALRRAGIEPKDIGHINVHGKSTHAMIWSRPRLPLGHGGGGTQDPCHRDEELLWSLRCWFWIS